MVGAILTFQYGDDFDRSRVEAIAQQAQTKFVGFPELRSKAFMVDEPARRAVNVYVWESREAAESFFDDALLEGVTGLYGVRPTVELVDVAALVENGATAPVG